MKVCTIMPLFRSRTIIEFESAWITSALSQFPFADAPEVFDAGVLNFAGTAEDPGVSRMVENLWRRLGPPDVERCSPGCLAAAASGRRPAQDQGHQQPHSTGREPDRPVVVPAERLLPGVLEPIERETGAGCHRVIKGNATFEFLEERRQLTIATTPLEFRDGRSRQRVRRFRVVVAAPQRSVEGTQVRQPLAPAPCHTSARRCSSSPRPAATARLRRSAANRPYSCAASTA